MFVSDYIIKVRYLLPLAGTGEQNLKLDSYVHENSATLPQYNFVASLAVNYPTLGF